MKHLQKKSFTVSTVEEGSFRQRDHLGTRSESAEDFVEGGTWTQTATDFRERL